MSYFKNRKLKKQFKEMVANAEPFKFTNMQGCEETIKLQGEVNFKDCCPFTIYLTCSFTDCNGKIKRRYHNISVPELDSFDERFKTIKKWMSNEIDEFQKLYKEEMGYKVDLNRLKALHIDECIHYCTNGSDDYIRSYIESDFKRACLYLQSLQQENLYYLDEYKKYVFNVFKSVFKYKVELKQEIASITANEPIARYDNYSKWLIGYQAILDKTAIEKEIENKVNDLDKLLKEVNETVNS